MQAEVGFFPTMCLFNYFSTNKVYTQQAWGLLRAPEVFGTLELLTMHFSAVL